MVLFRVSRHRTGIAWVLLALFLQVRSPLARGDPPPVLEAPKDSQPRDGGAFGWLFGFPQKPKHSNEGPVLTQPDPGGAPARGSYPYDGDFFRRMIITLGGGAIYQPGTEIDRLVGDPWTLSPDTALKLDRLPSRLRLQLYSALSTQNGSLKLDSPSGASPFNTYQGPQLHLDGASTRRFLSEAGSGLGNHFAPEEIIDLAVFYLSKQPFFPKTTGEWNQAKKRIVNNGAWIATGVLAAGVATNRASISLRGKIIKLPNPNYRIGWYGSVRDFGYSFQPSLRGGLQLNTPLFETSTGIVRHVGAPPGEEKTSFEFFARDRVLSRADSKTDRVDIGVYTNVRYLWDHGNPEEKRKITTEPGSPEKKTCSESRCSHFLARLVSFPTPTLVRPP
jgi:hypothetical protein